MERGFANFAISNILDLEELLNFICLNANFDSTAKQKLLEDKNTLSRAKKCYKLMYEDFQKLELRNQIHQKTTKDLDQQQREYYLNQQIKSINEELGETNSEIDEILAKADKIKWNDEVRKYFDKEIAKLQKQNTTSPDYNVLRNYLEFFTDLPWEKYSKDNFDILKAKKVLDKDHFGLEDIKTRILEHIAVLKLKNNIVSKKNPLQKKLNSPDSLQQRAKSNELIML